MSNKVVSIKDKRINAIAEHTLNTHFSYTYSKLNVNKYSECLIKETIKTCMKQIGLCVDMKDPAQVQILENMWSHLVMRFNVEKIEESDRYQND